jgi:Patatin-like phospholipase
VPVSISKRKNAVIALAASIHFLALWTVIMPTLFRDFYRLVFIIGMSALLTTGCAPERAIMSTDDMKQKLYQVNNHNDVVAKTIIDRAVASLEADLAAGRKPSIDMLVLSGGGDWGAYGCGFLRAWSTIPANDPRAMPDFDYVSGISTGSLIAPYVVLGQYARIDELYRSCTTDWAKPRPIKSLLSGGAMYDIRLLENIMSNEMRNFVAPALRTQSKSPCTIVVATADLDLGTLRLWDFTSLAAAGDVERLCAVQRAAVAIPAAFEPVEIDGTLQADAGVLMQMVAVGQIERLIGLLENWNNAHPQTPARLRYWVVVNNRTFASPTTVQPTWHDGLLRSSTMMIKSGVMGPLTSLWLRAEVLRSRGFEAEFHWTAIPSDFPIDETRAQFDPRTTHELSDLGKQVALSATPWQTAPPSYLHHEPIATPMTNVPLPP